MNVKRLLTWPALVLWRAFFWTYERATWQYDIMVIVILLFVWGTPGRFLADPMAMHSRGMIQWIMGWA